MALLYKDTLPAPPHGRRSWVRPIGLVPWRSAVCQQGENKDYVQLAGGEMGFAFVDIAQKEAGDVIVQRLSIAQWQSQAAEPEIAQAYLENLTKPRPDIAGLSMGQTHIMGIVNATPDSFSDGGLHFNAQDGIDAARAMAQQGATILDVGGESTRPGAEAVARDEEIRRITPIIEALTSEGYIVSADTRHTEVMAKAAQSGAPIINDVGGFRDAGAPELLSSVIEKDDTKGFAIAMHMQGTPETMQQNPQYDFAPTDVYDWLEERILVLEQAGVPRSHIAVDPGFGFGKTPNHNLEIIQWTSLFHGLGVPVLIGVSRKSSIAKLSKDEPAHARLGGSLALTLHAITQGAQIIRTHDVEQTAQAITIHQQLLRAG